jgi:hypothetical protein
VNSIRRFLTISRYGSAAAHGQRAGKMVVEGERYRLHLEGDPRKLDELVKASDPQTGPQKRYVYIGLTDSSGEGKLLFPEPGAGNQANRFPVVERDKQGRPFLPEDIPLAEIEIMPPPGVDHYYLLVSATPLSDPEVLNFAGAYQPDAEVRRGLDEDDLLTRLLRGIGDTRSAGRAQNPANWTIDHLLIRSIGR